MEPTNIFKDYNEGKKYKIFPAFKRNNPISIRLSNEARDNVIAIAKEFFSTEDSENNLLGKFVELIGIYALEVQYPENATDEESGTTTEECRHAGFLDGYMGNPAMFLNLYGNTLVDQFQRAYLRGFFEGNFLRTKGK